MNSGYYLSLCMGITFQLESAESCQRLEDASHHMGWSSATSLVLQCFFCKTGSFSPPHAHLWVWESIIWALVVMMAAGEFRGCVKWRT